MGRIIAINVAGWLTYIIVGLTLTAIDGADHVTTANQIEAAFAGVLVALGIATEKING